MQKIAVVLACLACAANGRRVQTSPLKGTADPLQALASLLASADQPDVAFNPSGVAARLPSGQGRISQRPRGIRMSDEDDFAVEPEESAEAEAPAAEPASSEAGEFLQQKSITDDLLDGLFGENSPFSRPSDAVEEEDEDDVTPEELDAMAQQLADDMEPLRWAAEGKFEEEYLKELQMQREVLAEVEAEREADPDFVPDETPEMEDDVVKEETLKMIDSVRLKNDLEEIAKKHRKHPEDTGSVALQVAQLSRKIAHLTEHMRRNRNDQHTRRGLDRMVQRRRKHLQYLLRTKPALFEKLTQEFGIRTQKFDTPEVSSGRRITALKLEQGRIQPKADPKDLKQKKLEKRKMAALKAKKVSRQR